MQAAVQQRVAGVPGRLQCPEQARGATAALVVIGDDMGCAVDTECAKQFLQRVVVRQQAHDRLSHRDDLRIVDVHGARHVQLPVVFRLAQVDNQKVLGT